MKSDLKDCSTPFTEERASYQGTWFAHENVNHSIGERVDCMTHIQRIESFWFTFIRTFKGTFHRLSHEHLQRYVNEFEGKHNISELDTMDQMRLVDMELKVKWLQYKKLVRHSGK